MVEHTAASPEVAVYVALAPVAELSLQRLHASALVVEYIAQLLQPRGRTAPAPAVVAALRCAGVPLEDHTPRQAQSQDKICRNSVALSVMTRTSRHSVVAPILRPHC